MELRLYITIIRQSWRIVALITFLAGGASLMAALLQQPRYTASARLLVTFADPARVDIEDPLAYDVAAIVSGRPFGTDVATLLGTQGRSITPELIMASLSATNSKREVWLTANTQDPDLPIPLLQAAVTQLQAGGLRYWGAAPVVSKQPGLSIVVLDTPNQVLQSNGPAVLAREVALRLFAGMTIGIALAFIRYYLWNTNATK